MTHTQAAYRLLVVLQILTASEVPGKDHGPWCLQFGERNSKAIFLAVFSLGEDKKIA